MRQHFVAFVVAFLVSAGLPSAVRAQETTLSGVVTDATDAVLPGVTVTALHVDTGNTFVGVTDASGTYRLSAIRVGTYRITAELAGFSTITRENVQLLVGQSVALNLKLTLSTVQESVTVSGAAPLVDTTGSELGGNVTPLQMQALPVNGRNWMQLTMLAPGSRANDVGESPTGIGGTTGGGSTRGDPGYYQLILDGQQVTNTMAQSTFGQPKFARDSIGEFQFISSRFEATQGRSQGIVVNAVTKSGTNTVSGSTYGYFRDDRFNAADFVAGRVLPYSNQQAGGTIGGPIVKDRVHFFGYYELEREPMTFVFAGQYPRFNIPDLSVTRVEHKTGFRLDGQISTRTRLLLRGNLWRNNLPIDIASSGSITGHPSTLNTRLYQNYQGYAALTQMLGRRSVHEMKAGWFIAFSDQYALDGLETSPRINLRGYTIGKSNSLPLRLNGHTWSFRDDFTTIVDGRGTHEVKLGGDVVWNHDFYEWNNFRYGLIDATGGPVPANIQDLFPVWNDPSTWNLVPLSRITVKYQQSFGTWSWVNVTPHVGSWVQDNWTVNSRLTLNLGVRWDLAYNWSANQWDVPPIRHKAPQDWWNFGPRLGFAYSLHEGRTVLRGGWGKYFVGPKDQWSHHTPANMSFTTPSTPNDGRPDFLADPYNGHPPTFAGQPTLISGGRNDSTGYIASDQNHVPYSHQTSAGFQRQLGSTISFQADYVWNAGRREQFTRNNNLTYDPVTGVNLPFSVFANRKWPELGIIQQTFSAGKSSYHALETAFTKRFSDRWQLSGTYTLSRFWDYIPSPVDNAFPVAADLGDTWQPAMGDQRHRAVLNGIWELPYSFQLSGLYFYGSGQRFATTYGADLRDSGAYSNRLRPSGTVVPANNLVGDPIHRVDMRVLRRFALYGRASIEGSFEVFNLFNHANYGNYVTVEANSLYGRPQQNFNVAYLPRMLQLGFRFTF